jgi:hypothetical protein
MNEAIIILMNMRGGCATVGDTVHALFRVTGRTRKAETDSSSDASKRGAVAGQAVSQRA